MVDVKLYLGDCLDVMAEMEPDSVDTVITDCPYGLGFMGKDWDHGIPGKRFWAEMLRVAKPGASLLAFGGTRTHHRLMCAIEDAGWEIRDVCMYLYGSGFPKSHDISKAIDKAAGAEREVVGERGYSSPDIRGNSSNGRGISGPMNEGRDRLNVPITAPATDAAATWDGWGTALKPAWEPIILAMKPRDGTFANNALVHGVAGLWIDGGRIPLNGDEDLDAVQRQHSLNPIRFGGAKPGDVIPMYKASGRWPANLILSHHAECVQVGMKRVRGTKGHDDIRDTPARSWKNSSTAGIRRVSHADADGMETVEAWDCHPDCPVRILGEQSGERASKWAQSKTPISNSMFLGDRYGDDRRDACNQWVGDTGTAARYFKIIAPHVTAVDIPVFLWYDVENQEVSQCCETASIAVLNSTLNHTMSRGDSEDFVAELVPMQAKESGASTTPGGSKTIATGDGIDIGARREAEKSTDNLSTDGFGSLPTAQYLMAMTSTTRTGITRTTTCPICGASLHLSIMPYTNGKEKITALEVTESSVGCAKGAGNTNGSPASISAGLEPIRAIVKIASAKSCENGASETGSTITPTCGNIDDSRPIRFRYTAKASRKERNAGLEGMEEREQGCCGEFAGDGRGRQTEHQPTTNHHPTVKPLDLMRYLCKLTKTPTGGIVLDPFMGSGTTGMAAIMEGREFIGIELDADYHEIARRRIAWAREQAQQLELELCPQK